MPSGSISTSTRSPRAGWSIDASAASSVRPSSRSTRSRTIGPMRLALSDDAHALVHRAPHVDGLRSDDLAVGDVADAEEAGDVLVEVAPELIWGRDLDDPSCAHDSDAIAERECLRLVVRDVHGGQGRAGRRAPRDLRADGRAGGDPAIPAARRGGGRAAPERVRARAPARCCSPPERASRRSAARSPPAPTSSRSPVVALDDRVVRVAAHRRPNATFPEHVAVGEEGVILEDEPDASAIRRRSGEVDPVQQHPPRIG